MQQEQPKQQQPMDSVPRNSTQLKGFQNEPKLGNMLNMTVDVCNTQIASMVNGAVLQFMMPCIRNERPEYNPKMGAFDCSTRIN